MPSKTNSTQSIDTRMAQQYEIQPDYKSNKNRKNLMINIPEKPKAIDYPINVFNIIIKMIYDLFRAKDSTNI